MQSQNPNSKSKIKIIATQSVNSNTNIQQSSPTINQNPTSQSPNKIKIISQQQAINPQLQTLLQQKLFSVVNDIDNQELKWTLDAEVENNQQNFQKWKFGFRGEEIVYIETEQGKISKEFPFGGKYISGTLKFPSNYPKDAPTFYFNTVQNQTIQHVNIYGDNSFCVPLLSHWQVGVSELEILMSIIHIFHHPNFGKGDSPANPIFSSFQEQEQFEIQQKQAQLMEDFE